MASLQSLCLVGVFIFTIRTEAQLTNFTIQVSNTTGSILTPNLTSEEKPELPPGGLPEIIVNPALNQKLPPEGVSEVIANPAVKLDLPPKAGNVITAETTTTVPALVAALSPTPMEEPSVAEKRTDVGSDFFKTPLVVNPDTLSIRVLGSKCIVPKDCVTINNTSCIASVCDCISGFIPSKHSLDRCIKVPTGIGEECEEEVQCAHAVPGSECRKGKCFCPPNFVFDLGRCWEKQFLGGMCNTSMQCDNVALSICAQGVCACQPPFIPSPSSNKCLPAAGMVYRAPCEEDIQCTDSYGDEAHCSNSQCICTNDYHFNGSTCLADKNLGDSCLNDEDCAVSEVRNILGSRTCVSNVCSCGSGYTVLSGENTCTPTINSSGEEFTVSITWFLCILVAKYYLS